jgi:hypothetical protein
MFPVFGNVLPRKIWQPCAAHVWPECLGRLLSQESATNVSFTVRCPPPSGFNCASILIKKLHFFPLRTRTRPPHFYNSAHNLLNFLAIFSPYNWGLWWPLNNHWGWAPLYGGIQTHGNWKRAVEPGPGHRYLLLCRWSHNTKYDWYCVHNPTWNMRKLKWRKIKWHFRSFIKNNKFSKIKSSWMGGNDNSPSSRSFC